MGSPSKSIRRFVGATRTGVAGATVAALAFFDGVFLGAPIALLAAAFRPSLVYVAAIARSSCS